MTSNALEPSPNNTPLSVKDETPVPPCATAKSVVSVNEAAVKAPVTSNPPVISTSSSIVTVPPAESIVKLPDDVSISLSPVCPTLILPDANPVNVPSPNTTLPAEPENTSVLFVASGINVNVLALSSKPKNPSLAAEPL